MVLIPRLHRRRRQPALMDQPGLAEADHVQALGGLERINRWSGSAGILWPAIRDLLQQTATPLRLLDVATGAGDVPLRLWHKARKRGWQLQIEACDLSATALAHAGKRAAECGADIRFFPWDIVSRPVPERYDIVTSSLFLHHLDNDQAVQVLRHLAQATGHLLLINDLRRSVLGWLLAYAGTRVLATSPVVHLDGPLSVEGAFTRAEVLDLARRAGLAGAIVRHRWPFRLLLSWSRGANGFA